MTINILSQFEKQASDFILLKFLNLKCSPIEIESSIEILLEMMNKISTLVDQSVKNLKEFIPFQKSQEEEDEKIQAVINQINLSKTDLFTHQIDYAFEFEAEEIHLVILKENRKHKIQWKFLPLYSIEMFDTKIVANIESIITQRNRDKLITRYGSK